MHSVVPRFGLFLLLLVPTSGRGEATLTEMRMCGRPSLSSDGTVLAVEWAGDVWVGSPFGGEARRLTASAAVDGYPKVSPDGTRVAFCSDRSGSRQVYVVPVDGGTPRQVTRHSEGSTLHGWSPDGKTLLISGLRDRGWKRAERLWLLDPEGVEPVRLAFDAHAKSGAIAHDGTIVLTRYGTHWWRQGYRGSRAAQAWRYDPTTEQFERLLSDRVAVRDPLPRGADGALLYLDNELGVFNLHERNADGEDRRLTEFESGAMTSPTLANEANLVVFRQLFDLYRLDLTSLGGPEKISLVCRTDAREAEERRTLEKASDVAFSSDGLEIAFIAGGDLWVMDTVLREPRQVTNTPCAESDPCFSPDGTQIAYVCDSEEGLDVWIAERGDPDAVWWQNWDFHHRPLTNDSAPDARPRYSPSGDRIAFAHAAGQIRVLTPSGEEMASVDTGWDVPQFEWSPDGEWFGYSTRDANYNRDVYVVAADGSADPIKLSRHPDQDGGLRWSPDGTKVAFTGVREQDETDIFVAYLAAAPPSGRYDRLAEAMELIAESRGESDGDATPDAAPIQPYTIDLDTSVVRISNPRVRESNLVWSPDSKRIAFTGDDGDSRDTYVVDCEGGDPERLSSQVGYGGRWIDDAVYWTSDGVPGRVQAGGGKHKTFPFKAYQRFDRQERGGAVFTACWRMVRDTFYDPMMHGVDWDAVHERYLPMARSAFDDRTLGEVIRMMLGELNASHQGFTAFGSDRETTWTERTAHLGCWFDADENGRPVIASASVDAERAGLRAGQVVLSIGGARIDSIDELTDRLTGAPNQAVRVVTQTGAEEPVQRTVYPITYSKARNELYRRWVDSRAADVDRLSDGRLGYLHIRSMNADSLEEFEAELFAATDGRDGLVVDVRFNGGGWTADRVLAMVAHPNHAVTTPRGGPDGYPQDRPVYATWTGPLVVLCNEYSVSNAEIFSHAIKSTGRARLVGQPTAGDVISTSSRSVAGFGRLRVTHRGWRVAKTGEGMEGGPAQPDIVVENLPGEMAKGIDRQLEAAVASLLGDIANQPETAQGG